MTSDAGMADDDSGKRDDLPPGYTAEAWAYEQATTTSELDRVLVALTELLAAVNVATLEDPSKHRVANTVGLAALRARAVLQRHNRGALVADAVQSLLAGTTDGATE